VLGKLYGKGTDTAPSTVDQNLLPALDVSLFEKVQCITSPKRNGGGFPIGHIGRFDGHSPFHLSRFFGQTYVLSISTKTHTGRSEYLVTLFEPPYVLAHCFNFSG